MLYKEVQDIKNKNGGVKNATGVCRFCGQIAQIEVLKDWGKDKSNELASEVCDCIESKIYKTKKEQQENASKRINLLFGTKSECAIRNEVVELLHKAVELICNGSLSSITIDVGNGIKGTIKVTSKGFIKVTRTKTDKSEYEA